MNPLTKIITVIVIVISILAVSFYFLGQEKSGSVMDVNVDVFMDENGTVHITNINGNLREMNKISIPKGNEMMLPGMLANVIYNEELIGYWTSERLNVDVPRNSITTYKITVGLFENPARGDNVSVTARIIGYKGETIESFMTTFKIPDRQ